jgi:ribose transport system substrate-binding protein
MRKSFVAAALTASALTLASCAMPADDPNYGGATGAGEEIDAAVASANAADQASLEDALLPPTSIGVDAPLTAAPASGGSIVSFTNGSEFEGVFETSLAEAADVLGWTVETVTIDPADPTSTATAFDDAVATSPAGIHITGDMVDSLTESLSSATAAGIPIVCTGCSSEPPIDGVDVSIDGTDQNLFWANVLASYVNNNQYSGEDAGVQVFTIPGGALADFNLEFATSLTDQCRNCSASESLIDPTLLDVTDAVGVADFVSSEMSLALGSWALLDSGALSNGSADALANDPLALTPIVVIGRGASAADIASMQAASGSVPAVEASPGADAASPEASPAADAASADVGTEGEVAVEGRTPEEALALQAWIGIPEPVMAWRVIDQFARIIGGDEPSTGPLPSQLLTAGTIAEAALDDNGDYIGIADYQDQFKALWGVQ